MAGHSHAAVAHEVAGIPVIQAYSWGRAFARLDLTVDRGAGVVSKQLFSPQVVCATVGPEGACVARGVKTPHYEGAPVEPDESVTRAVQPELERVNRWRETPLGVSIETPLERNRYGLVSPLGNLFADALRAAVPGVDVAIGLAARRGGLRADLPAGPLTRGSLYDAFPFDNRVVSLALNGAQLRQTLAGIVAGPRPWAPGCVRCPRPRSLQGRESGDRGRKAIGRADRSHRGAARGDDGLFCREGAVWLLFTGARDASGDGTSGPECCCRLGDRVARTAERRCPLQVGLAGRCWTADHASAAARSLPAHLNGHQVL